MAKVISFEERAVATLRDRLGAAESAKEDLIAFARGHSGATAAIHAAVLALIEADGLEALVRRRHAAIGRDCLGSIMPRWRWSPTARASGSRPAMSERSSRRSSTARSSGSSR